MMSLIYSLARPCTHRMPDGTSAWVQEVRADRWGAWWGWLCQLCGQGDVDAFAYLDATKEECLA